MPLPRHSAYKESKGDSPMKRITVLILIISLLLGLFSGAVGARETSGVLSLQQDAHRVELTNRSQKLVLADTGSGYQLSTFVLVGNTWEPMFDAGTPLIQGSAFDQYPTEYRVLSDSADKIQVELTGHHPTEGYDFTMTIEATADSPLFHFTIVNHLEAPLGVSGRQPTVMLWMDEPTGETVSVYQESPNYHSLGDSVYWNSCFPAAYVWADGKESAVFFNMEPMDWFSFQNGVNRFKSVQVRCSQRDGLLGIGMDLRKEMGSSTTIAAGDMVVDFYLYGAARRQAPSKLDALGVVVDEFGRCVPSEPVKEAVNFVNPENTSYQSLAENIAQQLMIENVTYRMMPFHTNKTDLTPGVWTDAPLFPEDTITEVVHRPDYATYGAYTPDRDRTEDDIYGDWNCCNNALIPWIAYERLNPDETQHTFIDTAVESLKVYYQDTSYAQAAEAAADVLSQLPSGQGSTQDLLADGTDWTAKSGENVALQSYVSSDSGTGSLVTDGSTDTVWVSNDEAGDHYVSIDLGSIQTIGKYTVTGLSGTAATRSFQLESSDDGVAWVLRDLVEDNEEATVTRAVAPFSARYVRVLVRQPAQDDSTVAQLREVELFAADALELEDFYNLSDWSVTGATFTSNGSQAILQKTGDGAAVSRQLRYSVTDYPILQLDVAALSTGATLTVTAERGSDTSLLLTAEEAGRYQVSLADTGWQGETDFTLTLSLSGNDGAQATLSLLECLSHTANLLLNRAYEDAAAATDGLDSTAFTAQGNTTLDVDLGAVETVGRYTVKHGTDSQASSMTVYASTDGESWTPVDTVTLSEEGSEPTDPPALPPLVFDMTTTDDIIESTSAEVTADSEGTYIRCTGDPFNETIVKKELTLDVDTYPTLEISLADMTPGATVHMQIGIPDVFEDFLTSTGPVSQDGTYRYDLTRYEALTGEVTVYVKFIVYGVDNGMTVTSMRALAPGGESTAALEEEFETVTDWQQTTENAEISTDGTTATIRRTQDEATFGFVAKEVSYNIDEAPLLQVDIAQLTDGARLHVLANDGENEYFVSPSEISNTGTITLNLKDRTGWSGEKTFLLKLMVVGPSGSTAQLDALRATNTPVGSVDDKFEDLSQWNIRENAEITAAPGGGATITGTGSTFGYVARNVEIDLDETPRLMVKVSSLGDASKFHVMLNDGAGDYFLSRTEMLAPGTYNFDLAKVTGWSGKKTVLLKLAVIGGAGASMTVEEIKAMAQPNASDVTARNIEPTEARYLRFEFQSQDTVSVREIEAYSSQDQLQLPTVSTAGELVQFSSHDYHTAVFTRQTAQDLSTWETLRVDVDRLTPGAAWNLSIAPSNSQTECLLFDEPITETGSFSVPIFQRTGWSGLQGYTLKLYVYGGTQQDISLSTLTLETGETERPVRPSRPSQPDPEPEETPALPFTDVPENAWYYESVYLAWQEGLIDGMSETSYQPSGSLTVAQTIKLAAALHLKANGESGKLENGTVHWYDPYVDYAVEQGIIEEAYRSRTKAQMDAAVTRSEFVHIFHGALDSYPAINTVAENAIPDVKMDDAYAAEIYDFYRAGILTGSDGEGTFQGTSTIRRSEAAAILIRMYDQTTREHIQLPG